jgi:hypothetical protein
VQNCLAKSGLGATASGKMTLALRVTADGQVQHACVFEDEVQQAPLTQCLLQAARQLVFARPDPPGFVDVHLPLKLAPVLSPPQKPVCL